MRYNGAVHRLDTFIYSLINARKAQLGARSRAATSAPDSSASELDPDVVSPECLLDALLLSRDEDGRGMELQPLRDELMTLLVAGLDMCFCGVEPIRPGHCCCRAAGVIELA
jgi:cytochrome P450